MAKEVGVIIIDSDDDDYGGGGCSGKTKGVANGERNWTLAPSTTGAENLVYLVCNFIQNTIK
jgi:hypothetical protein